MGMVIANISIPLDGYVTARSVDQEHGLGIGGEANPNGARDHDQRGT